MFYNQFYWGFIARQRTQFVERAARQHTNSQSTAGDTVLIAQFKSCLQIIIHANVKKNEERGWIIITF